MEGLQRNLCITQVLRFGMRWKKKKKKAAIAGMEKSL
jgi:hypothetical protein